MSTAYKCTDTTSLPRRQRPVLAIVAKINQVGDLVQAHCDLSVLLILKNLERVDALHLTLKGPKRTRDDMNALGVDEVDLNEVRHGSMVRANWPRNGIQAVTVRSDYPLVARKTLFSDLATGKNQDGA